MHGFADKRGTLVEHPEDVIQSVNIVGNNIVCDIYRWFYEDKTSK